MAAEQSVAREDSDGPYIETSEDVLRRKEEAKAAKDAQKRRLQGLFHFGAAGKQPLAAQDVPPPHDSTGMMMPAADQAAPEISAPEGSEPRTTEPQQTGPQKTGTPLSGVSLAVSSARAARLGHELHPSSLETAVD